MLPARCLLLHWQWPLLSWGWQQVAAPAQLQLPLVLPLGQLLPWHLPHHKAAASCPAAHHLLPPVLLMPHQLRPALQALHLQQGCSGCYPQQLPQRRPRSPWPHPPHCPLAPSGPGSV